MLGTIGFSGYRVACIIGTEPHEREKIQELLIDLKVEADFSLVASTDSLKDTIDYTALAALCKDLAMGRKHLLIETLAAAVVDEVFRRFPVKSAWICIRKPLAVSGAECAFVELKRESER